MIESEKRLLAKEKTKVYELKACTERSSAGVKLVRVADPPIIVTPGVMVPVAIRLFMAESRATWI